MNKNLMYICIIIFLVLVSFITLVLSYNIYNGEIDGDDYITDISTVGCNQISDDTVLCMMNRTYTNGSIIKVSVFQQI